TGTSAGLDFLTDTLWREEPPMTLAPGLPDTDPRSNHTPPQPKDFACHHELRGPPSRAGHTVWRTTTTAGPASAGKTLASASMEFSKGSTPFDRRGTSAGVVLPRWPRDDVGFCSVVRRHVRFHDGLQLGEGSRAPQLDQPLVDVGNSVRRTDPSGSDGAW